MRLRPFALERYFAKYEFSVKYILSASDCDGLLQSEVLSWADEGGRGIWDNLALGYTESLGMPLLRQEISSLYSGISADDTLIMAPEEGIFLTMNAICSPGDHVVVTFPGYQSLYEIASGLGCEVAFWQPDEENGWRFDVECLEALLRPNTKLIVVNFPHNPTGYLPPESDYRRIVELAAERGAYLLSDEMYRYMELNQDDRLPSGCELYDKAISLFGMSKTFGMAGVRIGWLVTRNQELYRSIAGLKDYTTICSSAPSEVLSLIALRNRNTIIERHLTRTRRNLKVLGEFFNEFDRLFSWVPPRAGTICFPRLLGERSAEELCERVVTEAGIMIAPSTTFGYGDRHIRIGFGRENTPEAVGMLRDYLRRAP